MYLVLLYVIAWTAFNYTADWNQKLNGLGVHCILTTTNILWSTKGCAYWNLTWMHEAWFEIHNAKYLSRNRISKWKCFSILSSQPTKIYKCMCIYF